MPEVPKALEIITVDSARAAILRRRAQPARVVTREIHQLIDRMLVTMHDAQGIGLAAPQVGASWRVIVTEFEGRRLTLVNPEVLRQDGDEVVSTEACLSIPGLLGDVPRAPRIVVRARNRRNKFVTIEAEGMLARILQHEIDHLDGILFPDRVRDPKTLRPAERTSEVVSPE